VPRGRQAPCRLQIPYPSAALSPRCKDELLERDRSKKRPTVRYWDGAALEARVERQALLLVKYGLCPVPGLVAQSVLPVSLLATKTISSAYATAVLRGLCTPELELSVALLELVSSWLTSMEVPGRNPHPSFSLDQDLYEWSDIAAGAHVHRYDRYALRAILASVRFLSKADRVNVAATDDALGVGVEVTPLPPPSTVSSALLSSVALLGNFDVSRSARSLLLTKRDDDV